MEAYPLPCITKLKPCKYLGLLLLMALAFPFSAGAQLSAPAYKRHISDSSYHDLQPDIPKKHFGRAVTELEVAEIVPWTIDRYIRKMDYAKISFKTVGNN